MQRGYKKLRLSTNISLYLRNDTRYGHSYYRVRIGNRTKAFEWYHFQWSWVTSNPDFKVTPLFDAEYPKKYTRYRHTDNGLGFLIASFLIHALFKGVILNDLSDLAKYLMTRSIARSLVVTAKSIQRHERNVIAVARLIRTSFIKLSVANLRPSTSVSLWKAYGDAVI